MLPANLTTNEVKNSAGTEVEFLRQSVSDRKVIFAQSAETPNAPHRITIQHSEVGSGLDLRRRSNIRVDKVIAGVSALPRTVTAGVTVDVPVGDISATTELKNVLAELLSFLATTGAGTTVLFDCSGTGSDSLVNGTN